MWKGLAIKPYDGSTNPYEHLNVFKTQMTLYTIDKTLWCKVFPTSLQEGPLVWFTKLPTNFVGEFQKGRILDEALQAELIPTLKESQTSQNATKTKKCHVYLYYLFY